MIGLAVASAIAAMTPAPSHAQPSPARLDTARPPARSAHARQLYRVRGNTPVGHGAPDPASRDAVPPDLDQRRRDGHMTPEERRLLRQHIEDAVRELYKR